jgi:hypothetical protein
VQVWNGHGRLRFDVRRHDERSESLRNLRYRLQRRDARL